MADILQKCVDYTLHRELRNASLYPYYRTISSPQDPVVTINGQKVIMLGSNNYLGLTNHEAVKEASLKALQKYGTGCAGSRLLNGTLDIHVNLEERLAQILGGVGVDQDKGAAEVFGELAVVEKLLIQQFAGASRG